MRHRHHNTYLETSRKHSTGQAGGYGVQGYAVLTTGLDAQGRADHSSRIVGLVLPRQPHLKACFRHHFLSFYWSGCFQAEYLKPDTVPDIDGKPGGGWCSRRSNC